MDYLLPLTIDELKAVAIIVGTPEDTIRGIPIYPELKSLQNRVKQCLAFVKTQELPLSFTEWVLPLEIEDLEALNRIICGELFLDKFLNATVRLPKKVRYALNFAKYQARYQAQGDINHIYKGENPNTEEYSPITMKGTPSDRRKFDIEMGFDDYDYDFRHFY